jgi:small-conductance mechanosensitive channel
MRTKQSIAAIVLVILAGATIYGLIRTNQPVPQLKSAARDRNSSQTQSNVDQTPLLTAQRLAQLPTNAEELPFATEALRLADQDMDLAFAEALRDAEAHPPVLTADAKEIQARLQESEKGLEADKALVARLTAALDKASEDRKDALNDQLEVAKAQQELDQDEVDDAKQDLIRAGGDPHGRIQAMLDEHEAASKSSDATRITVSTPAEAHGLIHRFQQWLALHQKRAQVDSAKRAADTAVNGLSARHNALEVQIKSARAAVPPAAPATPAKGSPASNAGSKKGNLSREESAALLKATKRQSAAQKALATLDKRVDTQKQLAEMYGNWSSVLTAMKHSVIHQMLIGLLIILVITLVGLFFDSWLERLLGKTSLDRRQVETLRTVTSVGVQVFAVLFILLVIFGPPSQLGTFLGLAGAGLTVALKDFIVAFIGWLVLMGKNGIRLGDWVEINGVTGEVVELNMFHTVLLETGNWTDSGHPTGRRVTFTNSYAIEGHYFNFSTSGQWLWDELQVVLPLGHDPYPIIDALQKKVLEATGQSTGEAEKEWKSAARSRDMSGLSAAPAINVKPVIGGVEIAVRYITRATERYQMRAQLYQAAVEMLGGKNVPTSPVAAQK